MTTEFSSFHRNFRRLLNKDCIVFQLSFFIFASCHYIRSKKDDTLLQRIKTPIKLTHSNLAPEVSFVTLFIIILTYLQNRLPHDRMKSYIECYHRKSLIQPLSLFQIIRTVLKIERNFKSWPERPKI